MNGLNVLLLGLLYRNGADLTGYDISKTIANRLTHIWHASHQQVYRQLNILAADHLAKCTLEPQVGKPDRKLYRISPAGVDATREAIRTFEVNKIKDLKCNIERDIISAYIYTADAFGMSEDACRIIDTATSTLTRQLATISKIEEDIQEPTEALCAAKKRREITLNLEWFEEAKKAIL